jgi:hypothetical protein
LGRGHRQMNSAAVHRSGPSAAASSSAPTPPTAARPGSSTTWWSRHPAGCRPLGRRRPRHAALLAPAAPGPGRLRRDRQALRRRDLRQRW